MTPNEITARLMDPFPQEFIRTRPGKGGQALRFIEASTMLRRLISATDNQFDFKVLDINQTGDVVIATCELEIPGLGKRQHIGCAKVNGSEDAYKACVTDSMKKILSLFGEGLELYSSDEQETATTPAPSESSQSRSGFGNGSGNDAPRTAATGKPEFKPIRRSA